MPGAQLGGSGNLNCSRAFLLLALAVVSLPYAFAAVEPLYVTVYVDRAIVDMEVLLNIHGNVTGLNQSAVALASVSIQVNDPHENTLHIALVYSDKSGGYSDTFQLPSVRPAGDYAIYVTARKPGFQNAYAKLAFSVGTPFSIDISPASVTVAQGGNATFRIMLESGGPSSSPVYVQVVGLPAHVSYSLSSSILTLSSAVTLTVETSEQAAPGSYNLTIIGTSSQAETRAKVEIIILERVTPGQPIWAALLAAAAVLAVIIIYRRRVMRKRPPSPEPATAKHLEGLTLTSSTLLSLPDHLRRTAIIVRELGEANAVQVAARSGRARAAESDYLNQLARMGLVKKKQRGRESYFSAE